MYDAGRIVFGCVIWECLVDPAHLGGVLGGGVEGVWRRLEQNEVLGIERVSEVGGDRVGGGSPVERELLARVTVDRSNTN